MPATSAPRQPREEPSDAGPVQHDVAQGRAVPAPRRRAGHVLRLRPDSLQLCPHRKLQDLPVRGPAPSLACRIGTRRVFHHEPHRCGRQDHQGRRCGGRTAARSRGAVHRRLPRRPALPQDQGCVGLSPRHRVHPADDRAGGVADRERGGLPQRRWVGLFRDREVPCLRQALPAGYPGVARRGQRAGLDRRVRQG